MMRLKSYERFDKIIDHLDPSLTDLEIVETWNNIYDKYGYRFDGLKDRWERENTPKIPKSFGDPKDNTSSTPIKLDIPFLGNKKIVEGMG